jgi:hypothetical protein
MNGTSPLHLPTLLWFIGFCLHMVCGGTLARGGRREVARTRGLQRVETVQVLMMSHWLKGPALKLLFVSGLYRGLAIMDAYEEGLLAYRRIPAAPGLVIGDTGKNSFVWEDLVCYTKGQQIRGVFLWMREQQLAEAKRDGRFLTWARQVANAADDPARSDGQAFLEVCRIRGTHFARLLWHVDGKTVPHCCYPLPNMAPDVDDMDGAKSFTDVQERMRFADTFDRRYCPGQLAYDYCMRGTAARWNGIGITLAQAAEAGIQPDFINAVRKACRTSFAACAWAEENRKLRQLGDSGGARVTTTAPPVRRTKPPRSCLADAVSVALRMATGPGQGKRARHASVHELFDRRPPELRRLGADQPDSSVKDAEGIVLDFGYKLESRFHLSSPRTLFSQAGGIFLVLVSATFGSVADGHFFAYDAERRLLQDGRAEAFSIPACGRRTASQHLRHACDPGVDVNLTRVWELEPLP